MHGSKSLQDALKDILRPLPAGNLGRSYPREELLQDLDFMIATMEQVHPNLYFHLSRDAAATAISQVSSRLRDGLSRIEFYIALARLASEFNDGHTGVHSPSEEYAAWAGREESLFPLDVDCSSGRIVVVRSHGGPEMKSGDAVDAIGGVPAADILDFMTSLYGFERMEMRLATVSRQFRKLLFLLFGGAEEYCVSSGDRELMLPGVSTERITGEIRTDDPEESAPYSYVIDADRGYALLDFRSFSDPKRFRVFLKRMFEEIAVAGVQRLIVDLRKNGGGNSMLTREFVSYVTDRPFLEYARLELKISRQIREYYSAIMKHIATFPLNLLPARFIYASPWRGRAGETTGIRNKPEKPGKRRPAYGGRLIILTGPYTFSSASDFAAVIQDNGIGCIAGLPTGGFPSTYGDSYPFSLPNTFLQCGVSHKLFIRPNGDETPQPVYPDYEFRSDDSDNAIDSLIEFAIGMDC